MFPVFLSACLLSLVTVVTHASGIALLVRRLPRISAVSGVWHIRRALLRVVWWLVVLHLAEISAWAVFYLWRGLMSDVETAFYFSGVTYTTIGYGDVVLAKPWRLLGPVEGLIGVLMCGLSTGYFFVVVNRMSQWQPRKDLAPSDSEA